MARSDSKYPVEFDIDYPKQLDRLTTFLRVFWSIPALVLISVLTSSGFQILHNETAKSSTTDIGGIVAGLFVATALMLVFRQRYPRWWFDFALELNRFSARVSAYLLLLTDKYPSTVDTQAVHLNIDYPNVRNLNRWLPLVKWFLAIPHYIVLIFLSIAGAFVTVFAWFAILFTGRYPRSLFDFVVGVSRWGARVNTYAFLLTTDIYPPFRLSK